MARAQVRPPCEVAWCVALRAIGSVYCAVHQQRGDTYRADLDVDDAAGDCPACAGSGDCSRCDGDGDHECACGDTHDCRACDGSGNCRACHGTGRVAGKGVAGKGGIDEAERALVQRYGWQYVPPVLVTWPWDHP